MNSSDNADYLAICELIKDSGLPTDDLDSQDLSLFIVEKSRDRMLAVGGLERFGDHALIRSVATTPECRGRGVARQIVAELEGLAGKLGLTELYLLTETAETFFEKLGYKPRERSQVPDSIKGSRQFSSICPDNATVMCKLLNT